MELPKSKAVHDSLQHAFRKMEVSIEGAGGRSQVVLTAVSLIILTVVYLALLHRRKVSSRHGQLPPGPQGWPLVGSLLSLGKLPHRSLSKLSTIYGPLMLVRFGSVPTLVVSNSHMAKEVLKTYDQVMASRPSNIGMVNYLSYNRQGIVFAEYGPHWRHIRKVCTLQLFTAARLTHFESMRRGEVLAMLHSILNKSQEGIPLNMYEVLSNLTTNIMTQMVWKKKYCIAMGNASSPEATAFREIAREISELCGSANVADYIPVLRPLDLQGFHKRAEIVHQRMDKFLQNIIEERLLQTESSPGTEQNVNEDFVDVLLKEVNSEESLSMDSVKAVLTDMILAGTETSLTTMEWALTEMVKQPSIMRRAQDELTSVVGKASLLREADVPNLKYIQAVIKETLRLHPPAPFAFHRSRHDCEIAGYYIPGRTVTLINLWAIHRDPTVWHRPLEFDPDRFLESNVDVKGQDYELIPFGSGRRMCPASNLALSLVHYALAQLLHAFTWTLPGDQNVEELDMSEIFGLTIPKGLPLTVLAKPRLPVDVISDPTFQ